MQSNKSILYTPTTSFTELSQDSHCILGHSPFALITPGPGSRQLRTVSIAQSLLKLFISVHPAYPALTVPSHKSHNEGPLPIFPPWSFCLLTNPGASPSGSLWQSCSLLLGTVRNKLSFQWRSSPDLSASPYPGDNEAYILQVIVISREVGVELSGRANA